MVIIQIMIKFICAETCEKTGKNSAKDDACDCSFNNNSFRTILLFTKASNKLVLTNLDSIEKLTLK